MRTTIACALLLLGAVVGAQAQGGDMTERLILPAVPYIGPNWQEKLDGPQDFMFPSAMAALMKYLQGPDYGYRFYLGVSGMAYRQLWRPGQWNCAFDDVFMLAEDPTKPIRRCFEAAGYDFRLVGNRAVCEGKPRLRDSLPQYAADEALTRQVVDSLRAGKPVIALGLYSGAALVAGYEDKGETLVGWTMAEPEQLKTNAEGYQRFPDWREKTLALIFAGEKRAPLPLREVCRRALQEAVVGSRLGRLGEYAAGQAALTAWAEDLVKSGPIQDSQKSQHFFISLLVAEGRAFAYDVVERAAEIEPGASADAYAALDCYHLMHDLVWRLWQTEGGGSEAEKLARFNKPEIRAELARVVLLHRDLDAVAAHHLARVAVALGVPEAELPPASDTEQQAFAQAEARRASCGANRAHLRRRSVDLWLEPTPELRFMGGRECTFVGALEAALAATARPYSYSDLMGYSGLAFRTRWFDNPQRQETAWGKLRWHPVSPHGEGPEELAAITRATGWKLRREELPADVNDPVRRRLLTDAVVSINDGLPLVIGRNTDLSALYGYNIHSMSFFLRDYQHPQPGALWVQEEDRGLQSPLIFLAGLGPQPPPQQALLDSLRWAVAQGKAPARDGFRYGPDALEAWEKALAEFETAEAEERKLLFMTNWWCLIHLCDARRAAVDFLQAQGALIPAAGQAKLTEAHDLYQQEAQLLEAFTRRNTRFIPWWGGAAGVEQWDAATRTAQQKLLTQVRALDTKALAALAEVGAAAGVN